MRLVQQIIQIVVSGCMLCLVQSSSALIADPRAHQGRMDLREWRFETQGLIELKGDWTVYWDELLSPRDIAGRPSPQTFPIPNSWESVERPARNGKTYPTRATFRLQMQLGKEQGPLALNVVNILSHFRIFVNGKQIAEHGAMNSLTKESRQIRHPIITSRPFEGESLDLVVQVSNDISSRGGIYRPIYLGPYKQAQQQRMIRLGFEMFLAGSILIIGFYHFGSFYFRRKDRASLFFSLLCLFITIRILFMGSRFAVILLEGISLEASLVIEFLALYLSLPAFLIFMYYLYPHEFSLRLLKVIAGLSLLLSLLVVRFNEVLFIYSMMGFEALALIGFAYVGFILVKAIARHREGAEIVFFGYLLLMITAINDILFNLGILETGVFLPAGLFAYIMAQALHLSRRSATNINRNEHLSAQLADTNLMLESRVRDRTEELKQRNDQLRQEIFDHKATTEKLKHSIEEAHQANQAKSEFLANISHELRTPMHAILGFTKLGLSRMEKIDKAKLGNYLSEVHDSASRLLLLLDDLLDISKAEAGKLEYHFSKTAMTDVVKDVIKEFSVAAREKSLSLNLVNAADNDIVVMDSERIRQVLRNLVSNAIRYSYPDTTIELALVRRDDRLTVSVGDRGVGIPEDELETIFDKFTQSRLTKTGAGGTGLGLAISRQIIEDHNGSISAQNINQGTRVSFTIPVERPHQLMRDK